MKTKYKRISDKKTTRQSSDIKTSSGMVVLLRSYSRSFKSSRRSNSYTIGFDQHEITVLIKLALPNRTLDLYRKTLALELVPMSQVLPMDKRVTADLLALGVTHESIDQVVAELNKLVRASRMAALDINSDHGFESDEYCGRVRDNNS